MTPTVVTHATVEADCRRIAQACGAAWLTQSAIRQLTGLGVSRFRAAAALGVASKRLEEHYVRRDESRLMTEWRAR
jgi:hypothetical protein